MHSDVFWHFRSSARAAAVEANTAGIGDLPPERRDLLWNFVIWPNFMANIYPGAGNISTNRLLPLAADRTLAIYDFYFEPSATDEQVRENIEFIDTVQQEDIALCESVQRGLRSGRLDRGRFIEPEVFLDRFVWEVARHVTDDELAAPVSPNRSRCSPPGRPSHRPPFVTGSLKRHSRTLAQQAVPSSHAARWKIVGTAT